jgi:protein required for attachment to host cells
MDRGGRVAVGAPIPMEGIDRAMPTPGRAADARRPRPSREILNMADNVWFLIADQSRASAHRPHSDGLLEELRAFSRPEVRAHDSDLMTGSRGRRPDPGTGQRSAMDRQTSVQDTEVAHLVSEVLDWLDTAAQRQAFDALVIVAAPQMLGALRDKLSPTLQLRLSETLDKNYASLSAEALTEHLRRHFGALLPEPDPSIPLRATRGNQQPTT